MLKQYDQNAPLAHNHGRPRIKFGDPSWEVDRQKARERYYTGNVFRIWAGIALVSARRRAKAKGLEFAITIDDILPIAEATTHCPILGVPLEYERGRGDGKRRFAASLDRLDNTKGYIPGNIGIASLRINVLKGSLSPDEIHNLARYIGVCK